MCILVISILTCVPAQAAAAYVTRLWGYDRYGTAAAISREGWKSSEYVILARGDDFPDALCAAPLAYMYKAPLLLTSPDKLNVDTGSEIKRLGAEHVIIVGGPGAISLSIEEELRSIGVKIVERICGEDRYGTSLRIAERLTGSSRIALAIGYDYPDALSISSIAARLGMPVLLIHKDYLDENVGRYIRDREIDLTYIIGGDGAIDSAVESQVPNPIRLGGIDRYETNVKVLREFEDILNFRSIYAALGEGSNGDEFADALTGSVLASLESSPLVLVNSIVPESIWYYLRQKAPHGGIVTILGGQGAINENVYNEFESLIGGQENYDSHVSIPEVLCANTVNGTMVEVSFTNELTHVNVDDFAFEGLNIKSAYIKQDDSKKVALVTAPQEFGKSYKLYYRGTVTDKSIIGAASIRLSPDNISGIWRSGEKVGVTFSLGLENGADPVESASIIMIWTRDGLPIKDGDIRTIYNGGIIDYESGRYIILDNYKVTRDESHTVDVIFNSKGFYECSIFTESADK